MALEADGFELRAAALSIPDVEAALAVLPVATRRLLDDAAVQALARRLAPAGFFAVRALLFDKSTESNWGLGWHQDLTVAVQQRRETPGFSAWTVKGGVTHAVAPVSLLERMVTLRLHLDDCGMENGPLRVKPGSHLGGRVDSFDGVPEHVCVALRGDVLAFKPLLLHASSSSSSGAHRRVLQLELAQDELPGDLRWRWRV